MMEMWQICVIGGVGSLIISFAAEWFVAWTANHWRQEKTQFRSRRPNDRS